MFKGSMHRFRVRSDGLSSQTVQAVTISTTWHPFVLVASKYPELSAIDQKRLRLEIRHADPLGYVLLLPDRSGHTSDRVPILRARFFIPGMSGEDPGTGSAAGPMAAYFSNTMSLDLKAGREYCVSVTAKEDGDGKVSTGLTAEGVDVIVRFSDP
ncbi:hypothetical protein PRK78_002104 [Emydomyces testavorans]|uniref:Uncharacterized protein n=1 Tax=Emydomyces testavorans TaxID=2070801 RepID=A0AAF0DDK9_9EURO|nr:hypothetical protein PRK78_002104 [Emydomyces testavorans]